MRAVSSMTLEEIKSAMIEHPPRLKDFTSGWGSINDYQSGLRQVGTAPPVEFPCIMEETTDLPKMLLARFYYWDPAPTSIRNNPNYNPHESRPLNAIDAIITKPSETSLGIIFSTRTLAYLNRKDGIIKSLENILQSDNSGNRISKQESHLRFENDEIFLWLTVQHRDNPQISEEILLDSINGISSRDRASRTADLKSGVDFERSNFLTAVAENDALGPIDIRFIKHFGSENYSYEIKLFEDGGFEVHKNNLHLPDMLNRENLMFDICLELAFSLIPQINDIFKNDIQDWSTKRIDVIKSSIESLESRYKSLKSSLERKQKESLQK